MHENEISKTIVDRCYHIHQKIGPGLFESVYETILEYELQKCGLFVERQKFAPLIWDDLKFDKAFRTDLLVEQKVLIEIKSIEAIGPLQPKQVLTYLRLLNMKLGLLVNFNVPLIKDGVQRIANNL